MHMNFRKLGRLALSITGLALAAASFGQFAKSNIEMYAHLDLAAFGAGTENGNDIWGYVSPSGREYAVVGLSNQVAFVEVTDPRHPDIVATIPHTNNLWGGVKVYGSVAYAVTETYTGIQVMDLSQIDSRIVTLVRTIAAPQRNHTIAVDPISGFLYTCGSRNGTGTTTVFSLANPLNPVQVGSASLTPVYIHESLPVTYTSGPYAGRQIFFGCSEGRGLDIYDVTNKNAPFLIKRVPYPNVRYAHQVWISADKHYLYLDDELDDNAFSYYSVTRVFDVSSLENASLVATFQSGVNSIDHNQYWKDGFLFQSNYTSGLRVFDTNDNPLSPTQTGFFDTYPADNNATYNGTWTNYPYFPSNTVVVNDINGGLFVLNVQAATTRTFRPSSLAVTSGESMTEDLASLKVSDDQGVSLFNDSSSLTAQVQFDGTSAVKQLGELKVHVEASVARNGLSQRLELFRFDNSTWQTVASGTGTTSDSATDVDLTTTAMQFVGGSGGVRARLTWSPINDESPAFDGWLHSVDVFTWTAIPYAR